MRQGSTKESTVSETHRENQRDEKEGGGRDREQKEREGERTGMGWGARVRGMITTTDSSSYHRLWIMLRLKRAKHLSFVSLNSTVPWWGPILSHRVLILSVISGTAECSIFHHLQAGGGG